MKYLKTYLLYKSPSDYKLFEDIKFNNNVSESERNQISDILLPLTDKGYKIDCNFGIGILSDTMFEITISETPQHRLNIYEITDDLKFVVSYLEKELLFKNIRALGYFHNRSIGRLHLNGHDTHALTKVSIIGHIK